MFYKHQLSFEDRCLETRRILDKYPDRVPIICEKATTHRLVPDLDNKKYLVHSDLTVGHLMFVIRKRMKIQPSSLAIISHHHPTTSATFITNTKIEMAFYICNIPKKIPLAKLCA